MAILTVQRLTLRQDHTFSFFIFIIIIIVIQVLSFMILKLGRGNVYIDIF